MAEHVKGDAIQDKAGTAGGTFPSLGISIDIPGAESSNRPPNIRHVSSPAYESPLRHHRRKQSTPRQVKETLHAHSEYTNSEDDGGAVHRINQYVIKQEIGRGSFGAVHLAVDQHGQEYAVKEFSKSRLRKRAQSHILRRPHAPRRAGHLNSGIGMNSPLFRHSASDIHEEEGGGNPLHLIKEEIAIMKKLNHQNLVSLIEVLDDPNEDSLYMVLEMCKKGVVMKIGVEEPADPYDDESCRCWFRDLVLGIEYLHAQGVVHRDIKPDNLLLTEDDVLKIVDFGVSEMFAKSSEMKTAKSAGSPAFLPPELCVAKHGDVSGKAADIWSMGVTLYCLRFGRIPFEKTGVLELYESIKNDDPAFDSQCSDDFKDLLRKMLEKDPSKRIQMPELRNHPWVTNGGTDPLLSAEENTADLVEPPTEEEMNSAITGNLSNLLVVMKAVKKFKNFLSVKRPEIMEDILGGHARIVQPPLSMLSPDASPIQHRARSVDSHDRRPIEQVLVAEGVHRDINLEGLSPAPTPPTETNDKQTEKKSQGPSHHPKGATHPGPSTHTSTSSSHRAVSGSTDHGKGHAHDPLSDQLFLSIGPGLGESSPSPSSTPPDPPIVSESPPAADIDIYETAYHNEVERIRQMQGRRATLYLTRRIEAGGKVGAGLAVGAGGLSRLLEMAREKGNKGENENENENGNGKDEKKVEDSEQGCEQPAGPGGLARILEMAREQGKKGEKRKDDEKANDQPA